MARIERLGALPLRTQTAGAFLIVHASNISVDAIRVVGNGSARLMDVISFSKGSIASKISNFYLADAAGDCIQVVDQAVYTFISTGNTAACGTGLHLRDASGIYVRDLDLVGSSASGILIDPSEKAGENVNALSADNVLAGHV